MLPGLPAGPPGPGPGGWTGDGPVLVPGELRGYRQFQLCADGLYPLVHARCGPWDGELERARCATGASHPAPAADCRCGLYAWYLPGCATVALGPVSAVVAARGRCILGDRGYRAAAARIEAVALPVGVRWNPRAAGRARAMLASRYPGTRVYPTARRMLKEHPPQDVRELGIDPPRDLSRAYRAALVVIWGMVVALAYSASALPQDRVSEVLHTWWPMLVVAAIVWQALLVWLLVRLMTLQGPAAPGGAPPRPPRPARQR